MKGTSLETKITGPYDIVEGASYIEALTKLQKNPGRNPTIIINDKKYVRPLTFQETVFAILMDENINQKYLSTCTAICYSRRPTKFKIIPMCKELITLPENFKENHLILKYNKIQAPRINTKRSKHNYNMPLSSKERHNHEFYKILIPNNKIRKKFMNMLDEKLLGKPNPIDMTYRSLKQSYGKGMGIYLTNKSKKGETLALCLIQGGNNYETSCYFSVNNSTNFVRLA